MEALLTGWAGVPLPCKNPGARRKARDAATAARRVVAPCVTPYVALLEHVAPSLRLTTSRGITAKILVDF